MSDVDLQACVNGDKRAWDAFVDRWSAVIHASVRRAAGGAAASELEDVVQDVFIRLVRDDCRLLRRYDPARSSLSTWLTLVARSTAIDHLRRTRRSASLEQSAEPAAAPARDDDAAGPAVPMHLLSGRQRLVLTLLFERGLGVEQVAEFLGVDAQTVRSTKHKAVSRLREALQVDPARPGSGDSGGWRAAADRTE